MSTDLASEKMAASGETSARWPAWLPPALILALAAALRLYHLGAENLWLDEVFSMEQVAAPWDGIDRYWNMGTRPLGLVLLYFATLFGDSEFLVRLPYAIVSVLDVGAIYLVSRDLAGRRIALRAALFLAVLPLHVWYAQEARWYAQWAFLATLSFLALIRLWKTGRTRWWLLHGVTLVMALYTFVVSIPLVIVHAVAGWLLPDRGERRAFRCKVLVVVLVAGALMLPVFYLAFAAAEGGGGRGAVGTPRATTLVALPYLFFAYVAGYTIGPSLAELHHLPSPGSILTSYPEVVLYYVVFMPIAALGLWSFRERRACGAVLGPWVAGFPLMVFAISVFQGQTFNVRYTFLAVPGFALLLSLGVEKLGRWRLAGTVAAVGLFAMSLQNFYADPRYDKEDVRGAIQYVRTSPLPDQPVAVVGQGVAAAAYYGEGLEVERLMGCGGAVEGRSDSRTPEVRLPDLRSQPSFWLVVVRDWEESADRCAERMTATHQVVRRAEFTGVDLLLLERR
ncbi:MAG: glycosyltransferase family 39 protein [Gemmatimonadota bacterium]